MKQSVGQNVPAKLFESNAMDELAQQSKVCQPTVVADTVVHQWHSKPDKKNKDAN